MKRLLALIVFVLLTASLLSCISAPAESSDEPQDSPKNITTSETMTTARVNRVIDGDTIEVSMGGNLYRVRYIGIDTPEVGQPGYEEATQVNAELVYGKDVRLEKDISETDRYGRLLRYVWVDDYMVNATLVAWGYAQVYTYPPDVKYQDQFLELQRHAVEQGLGLWAEPSQQEGQSSTAQGMYVGSINSDKYHFLT